MKDPKDKSTVDAFPVKKTGRRGPAKTTTDDERKEQNRLRQQRFQQRKKETEKAMKFALEMIQQIEYKKSRSSKSTLVEFVQFLQGIKTLDYCADCLVEDSDGRDKIMNFEQLKTAIWNDDDIEAIS